MPISLAPHEKNALEKFYRDLKDHFGGRLKRCLLFGSKARGDDWRESDVDILVLIESMSYEDKRWVISCGEEVNLEYLTSLSPLCFSPEGFEKLRAQERRLALDIEREGVPL